MAEKEISLLLISFFMLRFSHNVILTITSFTMSKIAILNAHRPENIAIAKEFIQQGLPVLLDSPLLTEDLKNLSRLSFVQVRFGCPKNVTQMKEVIAR